MGKGGGETWPVGREVGWWRDGKVRSRVKGEGDMGT